MTLSKGLVENAIPAIIRAFRTQYNSRKKKITSQQFRVRLAAIGIHIVDTEFRKCVKYIQYWGLLRYVVADSEGFYKTTSRKAVRTQIDALKSREMEIRKVRKAIEKHLAGGK